MSCKVILNNYKWLFFCGVLLLVACGKQAFIKPNEDNLAKQQILLSKSWKISARMAYSDGLQGGTATLKWSYQPMHEELVLILPMNQGRWKLSIGDQNILENPYGDSYIGSDVGELLSQHLDMELPVSFLKYWILGLPYVAKKTNGKKFNQQGLLTEFQQDQWTVQYKTFQNINDIILPKKIVADHTDYRVKLSIMQWHF